MSPMPRSGEDLQLTLSLALPQEIPSTWKRRIVQPTFGARTGSFHLKAEDSDDVVFGRLRDSAALGQSEPTAAAGLPSPQWSSADIPTPLPSLGSPYADSLIPGQPSTLSHLSSLSSLSSLHSLSSIHQNALLPQALVPSQPSSSFLEALSRARSSVGAFSTPGVLPDALPIAGASLARPLSTSLFSCASPPPAAPTALEAGIQEPQQQQQQQQQQLGILQLQLLQHQQLQNAAQRHQQQILLLKLREAQLREAELKIGLENPSQGVTKASARDHYGVSPLLMAASHPASSAAFDERPFKAPAVAFPSKSCTASAGEATSGEHDHGIISPGSKGSHEDPLRSLKRLRDADLDPVAHRDDLDGDVEDADTGCQGQKKMRLSGDEIALLEELFRRNQRPSLKQKESIAKKLSVRVRQVEVWFQNRRARTKIKQTEVELETLRERCKDLEERNEKLQKELRAAKSAQARQRTYSSK